MKSKDNSPVPGVEIRVDGCKGCGLCANACPKKVLVISDKINVLGY
ncbi:MAG: 4Fe-4S binding protein, partial [Oligoflexia bacterium]|nr:4Fe-4S binding protein [Oligoflexia bacterium]